MANPEHLAKLKEGVWVWNQWRTENPDIRSDLSAANLSETDLRNADLAGAILRKADFREADLRNADLRDTDLRDTDLRDADLRNADLRNADFKNADLRDPDLRNADLRNADLSEADLTRANLNSTNLRLANLVQANLTQANLAQADLSEADMALATLLGTDLTSADLSEANLKGATLIRTNLENANLSGCRVYGVSAWDIRLERAIQSNLVITLENSPGIQVDNLEVAQFLYLLLNNERIRHVIDTITSKVVLILGRFADERKSVLDAIRDELRERDYLPVLFDFRKPDSKDLTGTVTTLANMARFIIADLTDPSSVPHELATIIPGTVVPVQTILLNGQREFCNVR